VLGSRASIDAALNPAQPVTTDQRRRTSNLYATTCLWKTA